MYTCPDTRARARAPMCACVSIYSHICRNYPLLARIRLDGNTFFLITMSDSNDRTTEEKEKSIGWGKGHDLWGGFETIASASYSGISQPRDTMTPGLRTRLKSFKLPDNNNVCCSGNEPHSSRTPEDQVERYIRLKWENFRNHNIYLYVANDNDVWDKKSTYRVS
jgi:hypothetical protein